MHDRPANRSPAYKTTNWVIDNTIETKIVCRVHFLTKKRPTATINMAELTNITDTVTSAADATGWVDSRSRESAVSAANLLLVSLLKLNRALTPVLLRWMRGRRLHWIRNSSRDVLYDLINRPGKRMLCMGECCRDTYDIVWDMDQPRIDLKEDSADVSTTDKKPELFASSSTDEGEDQNMEDEVEAETRPLVTSDKIQALFSSSDSDDWTSSGLVPRYAREILGRGKDGKMSVGEKYYRLLSAQEELHRSQKVIPTVYESVISAWCTVFALVVYSTIIIYLMYTSFSMTRRDIITFSFSLVATATVSEADRLLRTVQTNRTKNNLAAKKVIADGSIPEVDMKPKIARMVSGVRLSKYRNRVEDGESSDLDDL